MLNKDINARFEDWLLSPTEGLDFEAKCWLDMSDKESHGILAKALIALENHGGGYIVIGYEEDEDKRLRPDPKRPESLEAYGPDAINAIVKRCAEPSFHVEVTFQRHPETKEEFPLLRVAGRSRVPIRSCSATSKSLRENVYYVRKPGPESEAPRTAAEWDQLLRRCVLNQREEIVGVLRAFLPSDGTAGGGLLAPSSKELLLSFVEASLKSWSALDASLDANHPGKLKHGHYHFSARVTGVRKGLDAKEVLTALESTPKYTGWPAFVLLHQEETRVRLAGGGLQAWIANCKYPGPSFSDFWRITPEGEFFLLRGYDEDDLEPGKGPPAGHGFEPTLPVWRLGDFLLRMTGVASSMFEAGFDVTVLCRWTGLKGRKTFSFGHRRYFGGAQCLEPSVETSGTFSQSMIQDLLPEVVKQLTSPLMLHFDMLKLPDLFYSEELENMRSGRG